MLKSTLSMGTLTALALEWVTSFYLEAHFSTHPYIPLIQIPISTLPGLVLIPLMEEATFVAKDSRWHIQDGFYYVMSQCLRVISIWFQRVPVETHYGEPGTAEVGGIRGNGGKLGQLWCTIFSPVILLSIHQQLHLQHYLTSPLHDTWKLSAINHASHVILQSNSGYINLWTTVYTIHMKLVSREFDR